MPEEFNRAIQRVLARQVKGFRSLQSCKQLTAGASQETYRVSIDTDKGEEHLALRRSQPTADSGSSVGGISLATEAQLFRVAGAAGIPGPAVVYVLQPDDGLGTGFLMEWLDGETLGQRIVRGQEYAQLRPRLARECGDILARIHAIDWQAAGLESGLPVVETPKLVDDTWACYRDLNVPVPMIDYTWRWLQDNLPPEPLPALVHGDFRNGNLMVTPQNINAVLDWELAQIGNPIRDLGWLCVNSWRFGQPALPVGGFGEIDDLLAGYNSRAGTQVSRGQLHYWQVFGSFWWAMATLQMANAWRSGETPSLERPVIGRRSSEAQMDCVTLLIPGTQQPPEPQSAISAGTQLPMPAELLEGVADFLKQEVAVQLDSHNSFLARVAANSIRIAQRELLVGPGLAAREQTRLAALLGGHDELDSMRWELVRRLRDGLALDTPGLAEHLRQTVAGQLAIDQPGYKYQ